MVDPGDPRRDRRDAWVLVSATGRHRAALVKFPRIYWLFSAVLMMAWALQTRWKRGSRLGLLAWIVGIVAGLLVLGRRVLEPVVSARFLLDALGVSAVLTGSSAAWFWLRGCARRVAERVPGGWQPYR